MHVIEKCHLTQTRTSKLRKLHFPGKSYHPQINFNNMLASFFGFQKHVGVHLDEKSNFNYHIKEEICKGMEGVGPIRQLSKTLPRNSFIIITESFVRPHFDNDDVLRIFFPEN